MNLREIKKSLAVDDGPEAVTVQRICGLADISERVLQLLREQGDQRHGTDVSAGVVASLAALRTVP